MLRRSTPAPVAVAVQEPLAKALPFSMIVPYRPTARQAPGLAQAAPNRSCEVLLVAPDQFPAPKASAFVRIVPPLATTAQEPALGQMAAVRVFEVPLVAGLQMTLPNVSVLVRMVPLSPTTRQLVMLPPAHVTPRKVRVV